MAIRRRWKGRPKVAGKQLVSEDNTFISLGLVLVLVSGCVSVGGAFAYAAIAKNRADEAVVEINRVKEQYSEIAASLARIEGRLGIERGK